MNCGFRNVNCGSFSFHCVLFSFNCDLFFSYCVYTYCHCVLFSSHCVHSFFNCVVLSNPCTKPRTYRLYPKAYPLTPKAVRACLVSTFKVSITFHRKEKKTHPQKIKTLKKLSPSMRIEKSNIRYENNTNVYCHSSTTIKPSC